MADNPTTISLDPAALFAGRYRLEAELGRGGMGVVYRAYDTLLDRPVAVKLLSAGELGTEGRARLLREAQAAARLNHPNIVAVYDAGEAGGAQYIVMELLSGPSLRELTGMSIVESLDIVRQICGALEHAHAGGIIHRDLKPENVLVTASGTVKLMDFGLALSRGAARLTTDGAIVGTFSYLAPELLLGGTATPQSDLYALGVLLYESVTGRAPFTGDSLMAVLAQHLEAPVVPPSTYNVAVPAALDTLVLRLLAKRPEDRPASAREVHETINGIEAAVAAPPTGETAIAPELSVLDRIARGRLVGRQDEIAQLREMWQQALAGQGQLALISGEPGVGKTRLAREAVLRVQLRGAVALQGGCYEHEAATPYMPFVEALRAWVHAQTPDRLKEQLGSTAPELARLAPEIESKLGPLDALPALAPNEERLRLFDHVARWLQMLAAERGLLLFLDDLHWADAGTLALLHYVLRQLRHERVLLLGAYREAELDRTHPLATALAEWNRERLVRRVPLGRLTHEETGALLATLLGEPDLPDEFVAAIHGETEGNPFFVEEVVKALVEGGAIAHTGERWEPGAVADLAIPQSIKEAVSRRLDRLTPGCIELLHAGAALGKTFDFRELAALHVAAEDALLDALDEATAAQLLRAAGGENFAFTHDKIREVLYSELNPVRRRRLHARIAEALESLYTSEPGEHAQDLAYHYIEAGVLAKGLHYAMLAAQNSRYVYAHDEALAYYEHARECAEALHDTERLARVHREIGWVYWQQGLFYEAAAALERAFALSPSPEERLELQLEIGAVYVGAGDARGEPHLSAVLEAYDPETQPNRVARAMAILARFYQYHARYSEAIDLLVRARALAEPHDDPYALSEIYVYLGGAYFQVARYQDSIECAQRNIALGERHQYPHAMALGYESLSENYGLLARWPEALACAARDKEIAQRIGSVERWAWAERDRGYALWSTGQLAPAVQAEQAALQLADKAGDRRLAVLILSDLALIQIDRGDYAVAREHAARAASLGQTLGHAQAIQWGQYPLIHWHIAQQEWDQAERLLDQTRELLAAAAQRPMPRVDLYVYVYLAQGRVAQAAEVIAVLLRPSNNPQLDAVRRRQHAEVLVAQKRLDAAEAEFTAAATALERFGAHLELARVLYRRAGLRRERGDEVAARLDFERARDLFAQCEAWPEHGRAEAALL